jgi:hypothetical protein
MGMAPRPERVGKKTPIYMRIGSGNRKKARENKRDKTEGKS